MSPASSAAPYNAQPMHGSASPTNIPAPISSDRFGLMGLLGVIRMTDQDVNTLALGCDLTTLGLNLNSTEYEFYSE